MRTKKLFFILVAFVLAILFFLDLAEASLGLTPAKRELNFDPGAKKLFEYRVSSDNPNQEMILYSEGDLSEYVELNKEKLIGGGSFKSTINFPEKIEKPGKHRIIIGVREKIDKELATVGTSLAVQGVIYVHVPYPGKYIEIQNFEAKNANAGEPVNFNFKLVNRGKENLTVKPKIDIYSRNKKKGALEFRKRKLSKEESVTLNKELDTQNYEPGNYHANLTVSYGENETKASTRFKLGTLNVKITNHTKKILLGGVKKFHIEIESRWNNKIKDIYSVVSISNKSSQLSKFKTPSVSLEPWKKKKLSGFLETKNLTEGEYKTNITVKYSGESTEKITETVFVKKETFSSTTLLAISIIGIIGVVVGIVFVIIYFRKKSKEEDENENKN